MPSIAPHGVRPESQSTPVGPETNVRYTGVNHVAFATNHMEKTIRFYRGLLGFRLTAAMGEPGFRHYFFEIDGQNAIAFFEWPDVEEVPRKPHGMPVVGPFSFDHLAFGVNTADDLWLIKDKLEAAGFEVSDAVDHGIVHSIYAYDPNGIPIELAVTVGKRPAKLISNDPALLPAAAEGPLPQPAKWPAVTRPTPKRERIVHPGVGSNVRFDE